MAKSKQMGPKAYPPLPPNPPENEQRVEVSLDHMRYVPRPVEKKEKTNG